MLTGIHLTINESELTAVATDSHRLSQRKATLENNATGNYDILVPGDSLSKLSKMLGETQEDVELQISENQVLFILVLILLRRRLKSMLTRCSAQSNVLRFCLTKGTTTLFAWLSILRPTRPRFLAILLKSATLKKFLISIRLKATNLKFHLTRII